ncbi:MAG TPA: DUF368 domain-containing protein [Chloroflexi bacterium]|nr:DUF368 domain-containing protein [Chloroflexota bacterium]
MEMNASDAAPHGLVATIRPVVAGFFIAAANLIPGVSGGTMALLLGVYEDMIDAIRAASDSRVIKFLLRFKIKQALDALPWRFLLALAIGAFLAVLALPHFLEWLFETHPILVAAFFFGLIAASVLVIVKRIERWSGSAVLGLAIGAVGTYLLVDLAPAQTPDAPWLLFLSVAVAISAMVLPGISGAYILILMGQYQHALSALTERDFFRIALVIVGAGVGLVTFSRLLSWLFKKQYNLTLAVLAGMVIGSLRKLWPWQVTADALDGIGRQINVLPPAWTGQVTLALILAVAGFVLVVALDRE